MGELAKKFGKVGAKGERGERFALKLWESIGYETIDYTQDWVKQKAGIDYAIKKVSPNPWKRFYTIDNKNNLQYRDNEFIIPIEVIKGKRRPGWFRTSQADRISHTHIKRNTLIYYDLGEMREALNPLIENGDVIPKLARSKCKMVYINANDPRFKDIIRKLH